MKTLLLPALAAFLVTSATQAAESTVQKVEEKTEQIAKDTGTAVKKAAKKTGTAVEDAAKKTEGAVKKAASKTAKGAKKISSDITNSDIYKKVETALGKPFTPEQQQKYADAWKAAQEKARAAEKEFADKVSEITGVGKKKTKKIVSDSGL